jgi:hypothetical protein
MILCSVYPRVLTGKSAESVPACSTTAAQDGFGTGVPGESRTSACLLGMSVVVAQMDAARGTVSRAIAGNILAKTQLRVVHGDA